MSPTTAVRRNRALVSHVLTERRVHARHDIPAALVPIGHQANEPQVMSSRILNLSVGGAKLCTDAPINSDCIWLAFSAEHRMVVEAEIIWSDFATRGPHEIIYGVSFTRMLSQAEFSRLVDSLTNQDNAPATYAPSVREREELLFTLFRGHSPQGARSRSKR